MEMITKMNAKPGRKRIIFAPRCNPNCQLSLILSHATLLVRLFRFNHSETRSGHRRMWMSERKTFAGCMLPIRQQCRRSGFRQCVS